MLVGALLSAVAVLAGACSGTDGDSGSSALVWSCFDVRGSLGSAAAVTGCFCAGEPPNSESFFGGSIEPVYECGPFDCCLLFPDGDGGMVCDCENSADCAARVASERDSERVERCPPAGSRPRYGCAEPGESCRSDYLERNDLVACCPGTLCADTAPGTSICTPCAATGKPCDGAPCCTGLECEAGRCQPARCAAMGAACANDEDCCGGICSREACLL